MSDENAELIKSARLADQAEKFLTSPLGRYLVERANREIAAATLKLVAADPEDAKLGREIRNEIYRATAVIDWIDEAVHDGLLAQDELIRRSDPQV